MDEAYLLPRSASIEDPLRIAVLISGGGSGLAALLRYQEAEARTHQTVLVLADSEGAGGLEHATHANRKLWESPTNYRRQAAKTTSSRGVSTHGPSQCRCGIGSSIRIHENPHPEFCQTMERSIGKHPSFSTSKVSRGSMLIGMHWPMEQPFQAAQFIW